MKDTGISPAVAGKKKMLPPCTAAVCSHKGRCHPWRLSSHLALMSEPSTFFSSMSPLPTCLLAAFPPPALASFPRPCPVPPHGTGGAALSYVDDLTPPWQQGGLGDRFEGAGFWV